MFDHDHSVKMPTEAGRYNPALFRKPRHLNQSLGSIQHHAQLSEMLRSDHSRLAGSIKCINHRSPCFDGSIEFGHSISRSVACGLPKVTRPHWSRRVGYRTFIMQLAHVTAASSWVTSPGLPHSGTPSSYLCRSIRMRGMFLQCSYVVIRARALFGRAVSRYPPCRTRFHKSAPAQS